MDTVDAPLFRGILLREMVKFGDFGRVMVKSGALRIDDPMVAIDVPIVDPDPIPIAIPFTPLTPMGAIMPPLPIPGSYSECIVVTVFTEPTVCTVFIDPTVFTLKVLW